MTEEVRSSVVNFQQSTHYLAFICNHKTNTRVKVELGDQCVDVNLFIEADAHIFSYLLNSFELGVILQGP